MDQIELKVKGSEKDMRLVMDSLQDIEEEYGLCLFTELANSVHENNICKYCGQWLITNPHKMGCETRRWSL